MGLSLQQCPGLMCSGLEFRLFSIVIITNHILKIRTDSFVGIYCYSQAIWLRGPVTNRENRTLRADENRSTGRNYRY